MSSGQHRQQEQHLEESGISNEAIAQARRNVQAAEQLFLQQNLLAGRHVGLVYADNAR